MPRLTIQTREFMSYFCAENAPLVALTRVNFSYFRILLKRVCKHPHGVVGPPLQHLLPFAETSITD